MPIVTRADMKITLHATLIGWQFDAPSEPAGEPSVIGRADGAVVQLLGPPERLGTFKLSIELDSPLGSLGQRTALLISLLTSCWPDDAALLSWSLEQMRALFVPLTTMMEALDDTHRVRLSCDRVANRFNVVFRLSDD